MPLVPSGSVGWTERGLARGRGARLQLELAHPKAANVELLDAELLDHGTPDHEPAFAAPFERIVFAIFEASRDAGNRAAFEATFA